MNNAPTLEIRKLQTQFLTSNGPVNAVNQVSLKVGKGKVLGLVGESGSGKSVTGFSIMRLIDPPGRIAGGRILFQGEDLLSFSPKEMRRIRGNRIAMIFQDPMMTLNPVLRIDTQMIEAVLAHRNVARRQAWQMSRDALGMVGIPSPEERLKSYPHQFSGGMRQRVAIAIAMLHRPELIIADEPTTALDVTIQNQILAEMQKLVAETDTSLIWITHDLSVVAGLSDDIAIMYAGRVVEAGPASEVLSCPAHPYTRGLIDSIPDRNKRGERLRQIPGMAPALARLPKGCPFQMRCEFRVNACAVDPHDNLSADARVVRCHRPLHQSEPV